MIRRPPRSTLFPTRRSSDLTRNLRAEEVASFSYHPLPAAEYVLIEVEDTGTGMTPEVQAKRSEEHTSELQSHSDLVCRLLLEKKKTASTSKRYSRNRVCLPT